MTIPTDAIARLSERLREIADLYVYTSPKPAAAAREAATAIDALKSERDALQARVKELEQDCAEAYQVVGVLAGAHADLFSDTQVTKALDNLSAASNGDPRPHNDVLPFSPVYVGDPVFVAESRALRAEQERDALQARVKELEQERNVQMLRALKATDCALRAEQERDEAYERAAEVAESVGHPVGASDGCGTYIPGTSADAARAIRRLAGPEKEGK